MDGLHEGHHAVRAEENVPVPMRDGVVLRADIYRPRDTGPFPALLWRTPYGKRLPWSVDFAERVASHGYVVVLQDFRGRYSSDGRFDPFFSATHGDNAILDGYDSVEWAAALPDTTGDVGTFG